MFTIAMNPHLTLLAMLLALGGLLSGCASHADDASLACGTASTALRFEKEWSESENLPAVGTFSTISLPCMKTVSNDLTIAARSRRNAIICMTRYHTHAGMGLGEFASVFFPANWLRPDAVIEVKAVTGKPFLDRTPGHRAFGIYLGLPSGDCTAIWLRVPSNLTGADLYSCMTGTETRPDVLTARIDAVGVSWQIEPRWRIGKWVDTQPATSTKSVQIRRP